MLYWLLNGYIKASQFKKICGACLFKTKSFPFCLINSVYSLYSTEWHGQGKCQLKCLNQINFPFFVMRFFFWGGGDSLCNYIFLHCSTNMLPHKSASRSNCDNIRINWHVCVLPDFSLENGAWCEYGLCHCISFHFKVDPFSDDMIFVLSLKMQTN